MLHAVQTIYSVAVLLAKKGLSRKIKTTAVYIIAVYNNNLIKQHYFDKSKKLY